MLPPLRPGSPCTNQARDSGQSPPSHLSQVRKHQRATLLSVEAFVEGLVPATITLNELYAIAFTSHGVIPEMPLLTAEVQLFNTRLRFVFVDTEMVLSIDHFIVRDAIIVAGVFRVDDFPLVQGDLAETVVVTFIKQVDDVLDRPFRGVGLRSCA